MSAKKTGRRTSASRRSFAARPASPVAEILAGIERAAAKVGVRWYLFGAQAVAAYGFVRTSADVDVTAEVPRRLLPAFLRAMKAAGFASRVEGDDAFIARTRVLPLLHVATKWPVDVVLAGPGLEVSFLERARRLEISGLGVPVIAPEDFVATKVIAGRPKDLEDVRGLLRQRAVRLDLARVRATLAAVEAAVDQSDLLPAFERLVRDARRRG